MQCDLTIQNKKFKITRIVDSAAMSISNDLLTSSPYRWALKTSLSIPIKLGPSTGRKKGAKSWR